MQFTAILLSLAATAAAIDVRAYTGDSCNGGSVGCQNINPNVCCTYANGRASVSANAIPSSWRIRAQGWTGGGCSFFGGERDSNGATDVCVPYTTRGDRTGGSYFFVGRKRAADETCVDDQSDGQKCTASIPADTVWLADGTAYNISGLSEDKVVEMTTIADSGAGPDAVPAEFQGLRR